MKLAFVTDYDVQDVRHWSGSGYFIARALQQQGIELEFCGPLVLSPAMRLFVKTKGLWYNRLRQQRYLRGHDAVVARYYARRVDRHLAQRPDIDMVFSPGAVPIAFLKDQRPFAIWSDATHAALFDFYADYTGLCRENVADGHQIESATLARASAAIFSSDWAATSAMQEYGAAPERVHVVPFGANMENPPSDDEVEFSIARRPRDRCRLLFIGVDWQRKGGPLVVEVVEQLNRSGLPTELTLVGCQPPAGAPLPSSSRREGFLSKNDPADYNRLRHLLAEHHFLIVPSMAEAFGLVYCEANAYGMPCLARRVGGVPTIVTDDENGWLFDGASGPAAYAAKILEVFTDYDRYVAVARQSRQSFLRKLNWDVAGRQAAEILRSCVSRVPAHV